MVFWCAFRKAACGVVRAAAVVFALNIGVSISEAQINPIHGLPPTPPPVVIPEECKKTPEDIIEEIEQGIDEIPDCSTRGRLGRVACCTLATQLSESGCERVLDTGMRCCRLRFPSWMPSSAVEYACTQAMYQYGVSDASEHCWRTRERRLKQVGCIKAPVAKKPQVTTADEAR